MERGPVAGPLPFPTYGGTTVTRVSELHRRFDGQPTRGSDVFTLGMWHWDTPRFPSHPNLPRKFTWITQEIEEYVTSLLVYHASFFRLSWRRAWGPSSSFAPF